MKEIWKDIEEWETLYQVSNYGNVRSLDRFIMRTNGEPLNHKGKVLKPVMSKGYYYVRLCDYTTKRHKLKLVSRLVAQAFIPNPDNLPEVNHKDENKLNNVIDNLEWCTRKYNNNYGHHNEKISKAFKGKRCGSANPMYGKPGPMRGKKHSTEIRLKISTKAKNRIWVHREIQTKRILISELADYLQNGYSLGRK